MSFLSGLFLIDCPASALNNAGKIEGARTANNTAVKQIRTREGIYPYVSAQAFRYWWREALKQVEGWTVSPVYRETSIAYTDANPILYAEDDCFGYMRAPSKKEDARKSRKEKNLLAGATPVQEKVTLTRQSPLKVSTLVSVAPLRELTTDFGVMSRQAGDPVTFEHEFYRTTLQGLLSLDLGMVGRFYHVERTGYKHLDQPRIQLARERGLEEYDGGRAYQLPLEERLGRVRMLLEGLARISGGARLAIHYTDVSPRLLLLAVARGGNHLFATVAGADGRGRPVLKCEALKEVMRVFKDEIISGLYVGLPQGYLDEQREEIAGTLQEISSGEEYGRRKTCLGHPVEAIGEFLQELEEQGQVWLE